MSQISIIFYIESTGFTLKSNLVNSHQLRMVPWLSAAGLGIWLWIIDAFSLGKRFCKVPIPILTVPKSLGVSVFFI